MDGPLRRAVYVTQAGLGLREFAGLVAAIPQVGESRSASCFWYVQEN